MRACVRAASLRLGVSEDITATAHAQLREPSEPSPGGKIDFFFRVAVDVLICTPNPGSLGELEGRVGL